MDNEIKRLIEVNNEHLRTKGKLLQEILDLKKQIIRQDKNLALINEQQSVIDGLQINESKLQMQVSRLNAEIVDLVLNKSILSNEIDDLKRNLSLMELQKENAFAEIERMKSIKWYKRLLGKK